MQTAEYLVAIQTFLITSKIVESFTIVEEWCQRDRGYIRVRLTLSQGDFVESAEYFVLVGQKCVPERYSHQWMDANRATLHRRWDNVPHYPGLAHFPHHIHLPDGQVISGESMSILDALQKIEMEISQKNE